MINLHTHLLDDPKLRLDENELFLLLHLVKRKNKEDFCFPSNNVLTRDTGWHIEKLLRVKKQLEQKGLIKVDRGNKGRNNRYHFTSDHIGIYVNGKSDIVGKSDNGFSGVSTTENRYTDTGKSVTEVLSTEVLSNKVLSNDKYLLKHSHSLIFMKVVDCFFDSLQEFRTYHLDTEEEKQAMNPTIRTQLDKIWRGAAEIFEAFKALNRRIPEVRMIERPYSGNDHPLSEAEDQIDAYLDYCDITKTHPVQKIESIPEKLISKDWCAWIQEWAIEEYKAGRFIPLLRDSDIRSYWLNFLFYDPLHYDVFVSKRNESIIYWGQDKYLKA